MKERDCANDIWRGFIVPVAACALLFGLLVINSDAAVIATTADNGGDNLPFDFDYAAPVTWSVGNGGSYADIASVVTGVEGGGSFLGTPMSIVNGVNNSGSATIVSVAWRTRIDVEVDGRAFTAIPGRLQWADPATQIALPRDSYNIIGDVAKIQGVPGDYVLQSHYNENAIIYERPYFTEQLFAQNDWLYLGWLDEVKGDGGLQNYYEWRRATEGNTGPAGTNPVLNFQGSFDEFLASIGGASNFNYSVYMGSYGVDTKDNTVWAVLNHNSIFAAVPEPSTIAILGLGALLFRRKK